MSEVLQERDPRVDPRVHDCVVKRRPGQGSDLVRTVEYVSALGTVVYSTKNRREESVCTLEAWRRWCRNGSVEVLRVAPDQQSTELMAVDVGYDVSRELTRLQNRLNPVQGKYLKHSEVLAGLAELALAVLYHPPGLRHRRITEADLRAVVERRRT